MRRTMSEKDLRFTKTHEWLKVEGGEALVGLSDFAQHELGDIVFIELPEVGRTIARGEVLTTVESVKSVSEIYAPVAGLVTEVNAALDGAPGLINTDPYGAGWIVRVKLTDPKDLASLLAAADYAKLTKE
jgi:glycine cleavage system H protein